MEFSEHEKTEMDVRDLRAQLLRAKEEVARTRAEVLEQVLAILEPLLSPESMLPRAPVVLMRNAVRAVRALRESR
ncbi:MAG TPA: hypothetical protein VFP50_15250 [Anaeromyxobacteraceae bacterium]|nr:hypothetical protein [Anaeromyxobacteraceae bacterium]